MLTFNYPKNDLQSIFIMNDGVEVGKITHCSELPESITVKLQTAEEIELMDSINNPEEFVNLESIYIHEDFRGKGLLGKALKEFHSLALDSSLEAITTLAAPNLLPFFEERGYSTLGFAPSIDKYVMKKTLRETPVLS